MIFFRFRCACWTALTLTLGVPWSPGRGEEAPPPAVFPAESKPTAVRIDEVRKLLASKKTSEAVQEIQAILTASGDDLVSVDAGRDVACRRLCHSLLARLPLDALQSYRNGVDPQAKKWLDQAETTRDARLLRRIVDEAFCSRPGEKAIDLLGDFAFERGDFAEAEAWWSLLLPHPSAFLFYPDPKTDPARTRAQILLARHFRGAYGWADDLQKYRKDYGSAEGEIAGKKGRYADILQQVADERNANPPAPTTEWLAFGGDATRGVTAVAPPRLLERMGSLCRWPNERQFSLKDRKPLEVDPVYDRGVGALLSNRSMAFEPVVADGKVLIADARYVTAYDLRTGAAETWHVAAELDGHTKPVPNLPAPPDLRYTVTVAGDHLYVRLGAETVRDAPATGKDDDSWLVCLSLKPLPNGERELWTMPATGQEDKTYAVFEGTPIVHDDLLYIASTRFVNGRALTRVICYPADTPEKPAELWHQDICETREFADKDRRYRQHLLTLAGPYVVYCSHSGAISALDALTGKPVWAVRYPSRGDKTADGDASPRDLAPCLFADGRLYVAPADYDKLLCLDAATGETLWQRGPLEVVHLLGVGEGRLIFTTPTGLRAVGADDGVDAWAQPAGGGSLPPAGRGLLIGDLVLWPTASKGPGALTVYAVRQRDGEQPDECDPSLLSHIPAGNLVYADGCLICADRQTLTIFTPPGMPLEEKEKQPRAEPESKRKRLGETLTKEKRALSPEPPSDAAGAKSVAAFKPTKEPEQRALAQPPYVRSWQATLDPGETPLAVVDDLLLCGLYQHEAQAREAASGKIRWRTPLSFHPTWADRSGGVVLAAGDGGAAGLRPEDGKIIWRYDALQADPLGDFHLMGSRLYCIQGERRLFALNADNGSVLWARWAPGARLCQPYPYGRFFHVFPVNTGVLLAQTSGGRRWLLDATTGAVLHDAPTVSEPWSRSPVLLPDGNVCIIPDAETVLLLDPVSGRDLWSYRLPGVTTKTGEAPRVTAGAHALLMTWALNIGWRVQRLDQATGKPLWNEPPQINTGELDVESWSQDADAFYGVQDRTLFARSLKDGLLLWRQPLAGPSGRWRTQRFGDTLLAYPIESKGRRFQFRWLTAALQWTGCSPPEEKPGRGYPIVCSDAKTGRLVQRLDFMVDSQSDARLDPAWGGVLPAFAMETTEGQSVVRVSAQGMIVVVNGKAWGLSAAK
jgi:outer membrane protein assembly factor BamB